MTSMPREYNNAHAKVRRLRGKASTHRCVGEGCERMGLDWATITGTNGSKLEDYQPMCRSCHMQYDRDIRDTPAARASRRASAARMNSPESRAKQAATITGHAVSPTTREKISAGVRRAHLEGRSRWSARTD